MTEQVTELVALGASVCASCQPCVEYHAGAARKLGVAEEDISAAFGVGKSVRKGAAGKMDMFLKDSFGPAGAVAAAGCDCADG